MAPGIISMQATASEGYENSQFSRKSKFYKRDVLNRIYYANDKLTMTSAHFSALNRSQSPHKGLHPHQKGLLCQSIKASKLNERNTSQSPIRQSRHQYFLKA